LRPPFQLKTCLQTVFCQRLITLTAAALCPQNLGECDTFSAQLLFFDAFPSVIASTSSQAKIFARISYSCSAIVLVDVAR
jgi:hypothetical protein